MRTKKGIALFLFEATIEQALNHGLEAGVNRFTGDGGLIKRHALYLSARMRIETALRVLLFDARILIDATSCKD